MNEIIKLLEESLKDGYLSKKERRLLDVELGQNFLSEQEMKQVKAQVYQLAKEKASPKNFKFIIEWIEDAISAIEKKQATSDAHFSPGDYCRNAIVDQIMSARKMLKICVFTISDDRIANRILERHRHGLPIQIISDDDKSFDMGSDIKRIAKAGVQVKIDDTPNHMHHKFMVADSDTLITGSYNWTRSAAERNHENILMTREPGVIRSFEEEFDKLWETMRDY